MGKNEARYVLFEPELVGWERGLDGAIRDARRLGVPLAVTTCGNRDEVRRRFPAAEVIVIEPRRGRRIYLACPYSDESDGVRAWRFEQVNRAAAKLMREGHLVFSPISHTHPIAEAGDLPKGWDFWEAYDRTFLEWADEVHVLMLDGWRESKGVAAEIRIAGKLRKRIVYVCPVTETKPGCFDCGLEYGGPGWVEAVIPDAAWNLIRPGGCAEGAGLLCITCICKRLRHIGLDGVPVFLCGSESVQAIAGDPADHLQLLRSWKPDGEPIEVDAIGRAKQLQGYEGKY